MHLTLTSVVFESFAFMATPLFPSHLTLTSVVFEYNREILKH